jgi:hypothetical protein
MTFNSMNGHDLDQLKIVTAGPEDEQLSSGQGMMSRVDDQHSRSCRQNRDDLSVFPSIAKTQAPVVNVPAGHYNASPVINERKRSLA